MAISMRYWVTIICDNCGKKLEFESLQMGADRVPIDWSQSVPPGEVLQREFCSKECQNEYEPSAKPWQDE